MYIKGQIQERVFPNVYMYTLCPIKRLLNESVIQDCALYIVGHCLATKVFFFRQIAGYPRDVGDCRSHEMHDRMYSN